MQHFPSIRFWNQYIMSMDMNKDTSLMSKYD